jgi:hypothetical protein
LSFVRIGIIKEPDGVYFEIKSNPLSDRQEKELCKYIAKRKLEIKKLSKKGSVSVPK